MFDIYLYLVYLFCCKQTALLIDQKQHKICRSHNHKVLAKSLSLSASGANQINVAYSDMKDISLDMTRCHKSETKKRAMWNVIY